MTEDTRYGYLPSDFGRSLPADPKAAAQTEVRITATLSRAARPVELRLQGARLGADLRIGGQSFAAGDAAPEIWSLIDEAKGVRISAHELRPVDAGPGEAPVTVLLTALPLKPGQSLDLSLPAPPGAAAVLRGGGVTSGARILTEGGKRPVEDIVAGDRVWTETGGFQPVLWHGVHALPARGVAAPVRLRRGTMGLTEDLLLAGSQWVRIETDAGAALVPASAFERAGRASREFGAMVTWHQLLLSQPALIQAGGLAIASLDAADRPPGDPPPDWPEGLAPGGAPPLPRLSEAAALERLG